MAQTLGDLNDTLSAVIDEKRLVQSMLKRLDAVEARPDAQREMLAEYVRNFDTLSNAVESIIRSIQGYNRDENRVLASIQRTVENYHWLIDDETIRGIEALVTKRTGFSLQKYVSQVQKKVIEVQFVKLKSSLTKQLEPILEQQKANEAKIVKLQEKLIDEQKKTADLCKLVKLLVQIVGGVLGCTMLAGLGLLGFAFASHPIFTSILSVVLVAFLGLLAYILWQEYKEDQQKQKQKQKQKESSHDEDDEEEWII